MLDSPSVVSDSDAHFREYSGLNDIVAGQTGAFVRDLGIIGQHSTLTLGGLDERSIGYFHDGVLLNEPLTGTYNASWYQTEQIERVEMITGTRAFLYGLNSTGGAINMVSKSFKAMHPYTWIRYSEATYGRVFFDGQISQNLSRRMNLTAGVQRNVTDGRYPNSDYDNWGARVKARYNLSNHLNLFFSENYTQTQTGLFGGGDYAATQPPEFLYDRLQATIVSNDTYEKITRHDLQLGLAATPFADSAGVTTFTAFSSSQLRELRDENNRPGADSFYIFDNHRVQWQGLKLNQHVQTDEVALDLGADFQSQQIVESPATGYRAETSINAHGKSEFRPAEWILFAGYARIDNYLKRTPLSYGADVSFRLRRWIALRAGYARSTRFPTFEELFWRSKNITGPAREFDNEQHHLLETGLSIDVDSVLWVNASFSRRTVYGQIVAFSSGTPAPYPGVQFLAGDKSVFDQIHTDVRLHLWHFVAEGSANYLTITQNPAQAAIGITNLQPEWWTSGGLFYRNTLVDHHLDLKIGVRGRAWGKQLGREYNPEALVFVPSSLPSIEIASTADAVLIAHISSAYVHIIWENLFDNNYVITPFYPMPDRAVRFGITWELVD